MRDSFREILAERNLDALFISNPINSYYLLGYKTVAPEDRDLWTLVTKKNIYAFTHELNYQLLEKQASKGHFTPRLMNRERPMGRQVAEIVKKEHLKTLGIEAEDLRVGELVGLQKALRKEAVRATWKKTNNLILALRAIKRKDELKKLAKAAEIADQCLREIVKTIKLGQGEREIARRITAWFRDSGYEPSFAPIVAVDASAAIPHYDSNLNLNRVKKGSLILIDYGVRYREYCSDTSRVFFYGSVSDELRKMYSMLLRAQQQTIEAVQKFRKAKDLDLYCRGLLKDSGVTHTHIYTHGTGHGVGLEVHEQPSIHPKSKDLINENQIITVEPGIYVPNRFGMRIEDTVLVGKDFSALSLTKFPKALQVVGI